jgi:hypothetical protein
VEISGVPVPTSAGELELTEGSVYWPSPEAKQPILNLRASGKLDGREVEVYRAGEAVGGATNILSEPPADQDQLRRWLFGGPPPAAMPSALFYPE